MDFLPGGANKTTTVELIRADAERTAALEHVAVGGSLTHLEESYRGDPELVLTAVKANGSAFRYASDRLRSDRDFLLTAIERSCDVLCHVGDEWKCNRDFVLQAIGRAFQHQRLIYKMVISIRSNSRDRSQWNCPLLRLH